MSFNSQITQFSYANWSSRSCTLRLSRPVIKGYCFYTVYFTSIPQHSDVAGFRILVYIYDITHHITLVSFEKNYLNVKMGLKIFYSSVDLRNAMYLTTKVIITKTGQLKLSLVCFNTDITHLPLLIT